MKEDGSFLLKNITTADEEEAASLPRPPPPPPPPIPPPTPKSLQDYDIFGFSGSALLIFNGVMTGLRGGYMIEAGLLQGTLCLWAADRFSVKESNAYFGTLTWAVVASQYALMHWRWKSMTYIPSSLLCLTCLGMSGRYYYHQLQYEMKSKAEKEQLDKW